MSSGVALTPEELDLVRDILARHLPPGVGVAAFGSRAGQAAKPWSDLDLALSGPEPLPLALLAELSEAFDDSVLPWKVDLVDRAGVSDAFGRIIDETAIPLD